MGANIKKASGFTLVEISIVMIIIGLLIGGTFGGLKLVENMQVTKTMQDLKSFESAALQFRNAYNRLPGDIPNPSTRLPNCTAAPCSTGGNGNRRIDYTSGWDEAITATDERFIIWHHLVAADLLAAEIQPSTDMSFGVGQPVSSIGGGLRVTASLGNFHSAVTRQMNAALMIIGTTQPSGVAWTAPQGSSCAQLGSLDRKMDDGLVYNGKLQSWCSATTNYLTDPYDISIPESMAVYDLQGF